MDDRKPVTWMQARLVETVLDLGNAFEFREDRGWHWLQRACFWVLRKIGAYAQETTRVWTRHPQDNDDLLKSLLGQEQEWLRLIHREDCRIYMGPEEHTEVLRMCDHLGSGHFTFDARIKITDRHGPRFHDVPITVVPWLKGAFIVPVE